MHPTHGPKADSNWMRSPKSTSPDPSRSSGQFVHRFSHTVRPPSIDLTTPQLVFVRTTHAPVRHTASLRGRDSLYSRSRFVALEDASRCSAVFGRRGLNTMPSSKQQEPAGKQTVVLHVVPGPENAAHQSAIGGGQTQAAGGGMQQAPPALQSVSLHNVPALAMSRLCSDSVGRLLHTLTATVPGQGAFDVGA